MIATVTQRQNIERAIVNDIVTLAFAHQYTVRIIDDIDACGECVVRRSGDMKTIMDAIMSTDGDTMRLYRPDGSGAGTIVFVWGNGFDCIQDYSDALDVFLAGIFEQIDTMQNIIG